MPTENVKRAPLKAKHIDPKPPSFYHKKQKPQKAKVKLIFKTLCA